MNKKGHCYKRKKKKTKTEQKSNVVVKIYNPLCHTLGKYCIYITYVNQDIE